MMWYVEEGIGEHRAVRLEGDRIAAARIQWPGELVAGTVEDAHRRAVDVAEEFAHDAAGEHQPMRGNRRGFRDAVSGAERRALAVW